MVAADSAVAVAACARLLRRPVEAVERLYGGRNSQVYRVDCGGPGEPTSYVAKQYFATPEDPRDRLQTEYRGLQFLRAQGIGNVPAPIAVDAESGWAAYQFIDGERASLGTVSDDEIAQAVAFVGDLAKVARRSNESDANAASEACFSIDAILHNLSARAAVLRTLPDGAAGVDQLRDFLSRRFDPLVSALNRWTDQQAKRYGFDRGAELPFRLRTIGPSDFGFHNALRTRAGRLVFVDFEYFGWDDPAKTIVDFLLHPAMILTEGQRRAFAEGVVGVLPDDPGLAGRARLVYPWFGLKWSLILLNEFVPEHLRRRHFAGVPDADRAAVLRRQMSLAEQLLDDLAVRYQDNPYLA